MLKFDGPFRTVTGPSNVADSPSSAVWLAASAAKPERSPCPALLAAPRRAAPPAHAALKAAAPRFGALASAAPLPHTQRIANCAS